MTSLAGYTDIGLALMAIHDVSSLPMLPSWAWMPLEALVTIVCVIRVLARRDARRMS